MKKKLLIITFVLLFIGAIVGIAFFGESSETVTAFSFTEDITVVGGVAEDKEHIVPFTLEEDGVYVVNVSWNTDTPGMITGLVLRNETNEIVVCVTGESVDAQSEELELTAGEYQAQYLFITNEEELKKLVEESGAVVYDNEEYTYAADEEYEIEYHFGIETTRSGAYQAGLLAGVLAGVGTGIILVALLLKFVRTDKRTKSVYDERQLQTRGDGFKYGFFTNIVYNAVLVLLYIADVKIPVAEEVILMFGVLGSVLVYVIYCIRKEAYISLNESASRLMIVFAVLGAVELFFGIMSCFEGTMIENGVVTFHAISLFCGIFLLIIFGVLFVHMKSRAAEEE